MTLTDRLGQAKFFYNVGKEYGEVFRGSLTGGAALTFVAKYLGLGTVGAIVIGALLVPVFVLIAITAGYAVVRWRIIHATIEREWEANPFQRAQIDTLRSMDAHLAWMRWAPEREWAHRDWDHESIRRSFSTQHANGYEERAHAQARER